MMFFLQDISVIFRNRSTCFPYRDPYKKLCYSFLLAFLILLSDARLSLALSSSYFDEIEMKIAKENNDKKVLMANNMFSAKKIQKTKISALYVEKAHHLWAIAEENALFQDELEEEDFLNVVKFISHFEGDLKKKWLWKKKKNILVNADGKLLKIPLQIYKNGHIYLHFGQYDQKKKKGGYKAFSRSIDFHEEKLYANLVSTVFNKSAGSKLLKELKIMSFLEPLEKTLSLRDASSYQGYQNGKLQHKIIFQTPLFESDMASYLQSHSGVKMQISLALKAAIAVRDLHEAGVIHRDLKPANFFVKKHGDDVELVLADFGLSQQFHQKFFGRSLSGTRGYMDPLICRDKLKEKWACDSVLSCKQADIYSLGMTFYSWLKGRDNQLRSLTRAINYIALPKKGYVQYQRDDFDQYMADIQKVHALQEPSLSYENDLKGRYEYLLWQMIHPDRAQRISLDAFIIKLRPLFEDPYFLLAS